ncbi:MAG: hypothetical protein LBQ66_09605 [Planctomycetaceae bacterium]|nr:hypothetical protein [Planctomycetaceae bacterium]
MEQASHRVPTTAASQPSRTTTDSLSPQLNEIVDVSDSLGCCLLGELKLKPSQAYSGYNSQLESPT